jgi:hypothetical protein
MFCPYWACGQKHKGAKLVPLRIENGHH